ncbi:MAG: UDP-N-acetylglucosamine 2-epimerase (non-hydrolyzing) [Chromatiales bacterium]|nr:UDP-N-acetylglucosamine 2-epimerase (non-hydrolyzing) [Chromatiales bacterium]
MSKIEHVCVVGARPNFMKAAPLVRAFAASGHKLALIHTGQHYDTEMDRAFFDQLDLPAPDVNLNVGSASHARQTAEVMLRIEPELLRLKPRWLLVVGDVNSTLAAALVAVKLGIAVAHVEAGLRSGDRTMPEEINRILTDQLSERLFVTEPDGVDNLVREGIASERIALVGNVMIDTLHHSLLRAVPATTTLAGHGGGDLAAGYGLLTLHRPSNVDDPVALARLIDVLCEISRQLPLVWPVHPRTRGRLAEPAIQARLAAAQIIQLAPQGYLEMLGLMREARVVLTDSGGIQEETTALGVPCITLRNSTERPVTMTEGTNQLTGTDPERVRAAFAKVMDGRAPRGRVPQLWDGHAAQRIAEALLSREGTAHQVARA